MGAQGPLDAAKQVFALAAQELATRRFLPSTVRIWLSGGIAQAFTCPALEGLKTSKEVQAYAEGLSGTETSLGSEPLAVEIDRWPWPESTVGAAMRRGFLQDVRVAARAANLTIASLRPWWVDAVRSPSIVAGAEVVVVEDPDSLTILTGNVHLQGALAYVPCPRESAGVVNRIVAARPGARGVRVTLATESRDCAARSPFPLHIETIA
jgi:hypothetical protein